MCLKSEFFNRIDPFETVANDRFRAGYLEPSLAYFHNRGCRTRKALKHYPSFPTPSGDRDGTGSRSVQRLKPETTGDLSK